MPRHSRAHEPEPSASYWEVYSPPTGNERWSAFEPDDSCRVELSETEKLARKVANLEKRIVALEARLESEHAET